MKKRSLLSILLVFTMLLLTLSGCAGKDGGTIDLVVAAPMTGSMAQWGETVKNGAQLAVDQWNANGGVLGKQITLTVEDDQGDPAEAASVAQKIVAADKYVGVIGHYTTSCTLAASPTYQNASLPEIAIASTNPGATAAGEYIFRINPTNTGQGMGIVNWTVEQGKSKLAIFYVNNDYGKGMFDIATETIANLPAEVVYSAAIAPEGEDDFSVILTNVKDSGADALILLNYYAENAKIAMQMDALGLDILTVSSDGAYSPDFVKLAGESAEGVYVATWFHPESERPETQKFLDDYKNAFSVESDTWAPFSYDATNIMLQAIKDAGTTDSDAVRAKIAATSNYSGCTGNITFDAERVPDLTQMELLFTCITNGEFKLAK